MRLYFIRMFSFVAFIVSMSMVMSAFTASEAKAFVVPEDKVKNKDGYQKDEPLKVEKRKKKIDDPLLNTLLNGVSEPAPLLDILDIYVFDDTIFADFENNGAGIDSSNFALVTYGIENYGTANQTVTPIPYVPLPAGTDTSKLKCGYVSGSAYYFNYLSCERPIVRNDLNIDLRGMDIGLAAIPASQATNPPAVWPPTGAEDYGVALWSEIGGPVDVAERTDGGPSNSIECMRVCSGDPIDTYNGNFYESVSDLGISGRIGIDISRSFSTRLNSGGESFGNWRSSYDMHLTETDAGSKVVLTEENGSTIAFQRDIVDASKYVGGSPLIKVDVTKTSTGWEVVRWNTPLITFVFGSDGKLSSLKDTNGNSVIITRDQSNKITKVQEGSRWVDYTWSSSAPVVTTVSDHAGRAVGYTYDSSHRLASVTDLNGKTESYTYDSLNRVVTMTNKVGGVTTNAYDAQNRVIKQTSPGGQVIDMDYGAVDAAGRVVNTERTGLQARELTYLRGRIESVLDSDEIQNEVHNYYDSRGLLAREKKSVNGVINVYTHSYSMNGELTSTIHSGTVEENFLWTTDHQLETHSAGSGLTTEYSYDTNGNLTAEKEFPANSNTGRQTTYSYSPQGDVTGVTNVLGGVTLLTYNPEGEPMSVTNPTGGVTTYEYDSLGRLNKDMSPGGNVANSDHAKFSRSYTYNALGEQLSVTTPDGTTVYEYDNEGHPVSISDPRGKISTKTYNADGMVTQIFYPDGTKDTFAYDPMTHRLISWTDSNGRVTRYQKGTLGGTVTNPDGTQIETMTYPNLYHSETFEIDSVSGFRIAMDRTIIDDNKIVKNKYLMNRNLQTEHRETTVTSAASGLKESETTPNGTTTFSYDGWGNLTSSDSTIAGRKVLYEYDLAGNVTKMTYPDGTSVSRELDNSGRVAKMIDWAGTEYQISYNANGNVISVVASNGVKHETEYDGSRAISKDWTDTTTGQLLASFENTHASSGLLDADTKTVGGATSQRAFTWGDNGQLTGVNGQTVQWEGKYVMATDKLKSLSYDQISGRLTSVINVDDSVVSFSYDAFGNRTSKSDGATTSSYSWDSLNRMTAANNDTYTYGADGMRSAINGDQQVYGQDLKLMSDGVSKYLWGMDGSLLTQAPLGSVTDSESVLAITDGMGSVYAMIQSEPVPGSATGQFVFTIKSQYAYSSFGARTLVSGTDTSSIGFVSEQHDSSGLVYLRARYYDPSTAQFMSLDPMVMTTLDPYGYANGNPLQVIDPLGLWGWNPMEWTASEWGTVGAVAGVASLAIGIAAATVFTGGAALPLIVMGLNGVSTAAAVFATAKSCTEGSSFDCASNGGSIAASLIPFGVGRVLNKTAWGNIMSSHAKHLAPRGRHVGEGQRQLARLQWFGGNSSGISYDLGSKAARSIICG